MYKYLVVHIDSISSPIFLNHSRGCIPNLWGNYGNKRETLEIEF